MSGNPAVNENLLDEFRRRLEGDRARLLRTVALTDEELATLEAHQPGGPLEDASSEFDGTILARLEGRERHELDAIDAAQKRLAAGTFGVCDACSQPIPLSRLRAVPTAQHCLPCQARIERSEQGTG